MVTIKEKEAIKVKNKRALFISFDYSLELVDKVKQLKTRYYNPKTHEWEVPKRDYLDVIRLFNGEVNIDASVDKKLLKKADNVKTFNDVDVSKYSKYKPKTKSYQHQLDAMNYAINNNKFLLADEQGLGKTKEAIDIACMHKGEFKYCLIVCGVNSVKVNWLNEVCKHSKEKAHILGSSINRKGKLKIGSIKTRFEDLTAIYNGTSRYSNCYFLITNVETLRYDKIQDLLSTMTLDGTIGMTVIDEIHKCKNPAGGIGKAIHSLKSYYKIGLTGTPLMNYPLDLYNLLKWLDVEFHSFYQFKQYYCILGGYGGGEVLGFKNLAKLKHKLNNVMLRRLKEDVLDLPPKVVQDEFIEMTVKQTKIYNSVLNSVKDDLDKITTSNNPLAQLTRLRQVTDYTGLVSERVLESAKLDRLEELIDTINANGKKTIIFSNWEKVTQEVKKRLIRFNPAYITGKVKNIDDEVQKFQNDDSCKIIIGTIGAMGTGLTLTAASYVIFLDEPWNRALKDQAEDRAYRIGTNSTVSIITLLCNNTIDVKVHELVKQKGQYSDVLVDGKVNKMNKNKLVEWLLE
ncbi:putative helicase [Clostridium phage phiCTP1]|uniref:putative helicase n=1 Tax=Clostridium phage phiCTP1 TaxID=871584 RepID=UPI0001E0782F|nr:putative helicase [Clostridium phage phiCTP1]ADL40334.1 putative helicase [Clostridium phage phiCTP1]WMU07965.1 hypothetical protein vBCtySFA88_00033 [Clostridium phage vB_CtyS-FA88]